jgi:hypothetical protein
MGPMQADAILRAMAGGAVLHVAFVEGERVYWLTESNGLASVPIPGMEGKHVSESPLVESCEPGLFDGYAQSFKFRNGGK